MCPTKKNKWPTLPPHLLVNVKNLAESNLFQSLYVRYTHCQDFTGSWIIRRQQKWFGTAAASCVDVFIFMYSRQTVDLTLKRMTTWPRCLPGDSTQKINLKINLHYLDMAIHCTPQFFWTLAWVCAPWCVLILRGIHPYASHKYSWS